MAKTKKKQTAQKKQKKFTKFRAYCMKNGITQKEIRNKTALSIGCIHGMWNDTKTNDSSIKLVSLVFDIDEAKLKKMIRELADFDSFDV